MGLPAPVVGQLVPSYTNQPSGRHPDGRIAADRVDGGQEGLPGQVLRHRRLPAPGQQVAVHDRQRLVVEREQRGTGLTGHGWLLAHTCIVVPAAYALTPRRRLLLSTAASRCCRLQPPAGRLYPLTLSSG